MPVTFCPSCAPFPAHCHIRQPAPVGVVEDKVFRGAMVRGKLRNNWPFGLLPAPIFKAAVQFGAPEGKYQLKSAAVGRALQQPIVLPPCSGREFEAFQNSMTRPPSFSQYDAFSKFASKPQRFLLGTSGTPSGYRRGKTRRTFPRPLVGFTDLICYLGISKDTKSLSLCNGFIEFVLSSSRSISSPL